MAPGQRGEPLRAGAEDVARRALRCHRGRRHHLAARADRRTQELGLPLRLGPGLLVHPRRPHQPRLARRSPRRRLLAPQRDDATTAPDLHVFYSLDGHVADRAGHTRHPGLAAQPTRTFRELRRQADTARHLRRPVRHHRPLLRRGTSHRPGHRPHAGRSRRPLLRRLATPRTRASGSWTTCRHYTISKIGCWVALDRAANLAERARSRPRTSNAGAGADEIRAGSMSTAGPMPNRPTPFTPARTTSMPLSSWPAAPASNVAATGLHHRRHRHRTGPRTAPLPLHAAWTGGGRVRRLQLLDGRCPGPDRPDRAGL